MSAVLCEPGTVPRTRTGELRLYHFWWTILEVFASQEESVGVIVNPTVLEIPGITWINKMATEELMKN